MSWKERVRPSHNSEAMFYKVIGLIVLLIVIESDLDTLRPFGRGLYLIAVIGGIGYPIWRSIRSNYELSFGKSFWLSALIIALLVPGLIALFFCYGLIIAIFPLFLPTQLVEMVELILFIVLIASFVIKFNGLVSFLQHSLLERIFTLVPKVVTEN